MKKKRVIGDKGGKRLLQWTRYKVERDLCLPLIFLASFCKLEKDEIELWFNESYENEWRTRKNETELV